MKKILSSILITILISTTSYAITADQILKKIDDNMLSQTAKSYAKMVITIGKETREKIMVSYSKGNDRSFAEFFSPARDKGVKYLKINKEMWIYMPSAEKVIKIAGHMLRQSMMGSDFSYEDALESNELTEKYTAKIEGETTINDRPCYVLTLNAKVDDVTYWQRKLYVDKERFIALKEELFAKSGKKLKILTVDKVRQFGSRWYPTKITMQNLLRQDSKTEFIIENIKFNISIPEAVFSVQNLEKK